MSDKIDETIPGGKYIGTDGRYHDANGNDLGPVGVEPVKPADDDEAQSAAEKPAAKSAAKK